VGQEFVGDIVSVATQGVDSLAEVAAVPQHDRGDEQVQAAGTSFLPDAGGACSMQLNDDRTYTSAFPCARAAYYPSCGSRRPSARRPQFSRIISANGRLGSGGLGVCCYILRAGIQISIGWRPASRRLSLACRRFAQNRPISATQ
jgi:hypothetical protein